MVAIFVAVLSIPLASAQSLNLSKAQTSSWILALYGLPAVFSLLLTLRYRQPIILPSNLFIIIFISRLGGQIRYPELAGACIVAGVAVLAVNLLGLSARLTVWVPMPVVFGLLAGAVMPFVAGIFTQAGDAPLLVSGTLLAYLASRRLFGKRLPAILPAVVVGLTLAAMTGQIGQVPASLSLDVPEIISPQFSLSAIIATTPVFVILIVLQANLPSLLFLRSQDYHPPESVINAVSGIGTILGSLLGPTGVSLGLPATSVVAGAEAGDHSIRHRSVYVAAVAGLLIGVMAGVATEIATIIPRALLLAFAGLAVVDVLASALPRITEGPLILGPLFTFAIALSDISLLGFGPFFWALVIGTGISLLLERNGLKRLHDQEHERSSVETSAS